MTDTSTTKRLTPTERGKLGRALAKQYRAGASIRALATEHGHSYGFVQKLLHESGATVRTRGRAARGV